MGIVLIGRVKSNSLNYTLGVLDVFQSNWLCDREIFYKYLIFVYSASQIVLMCELFMAGGQLAGGQLAGDFLRGRTIGR